jgi:hypothetical protein
MAPPFDWSFENIITTRRDIIVEKLTELSQVDPILLQNLERRIVENNQVIKQGLADCEQLESIIETL